MGTCSPLICVHGTADAVDLMDAGGWKRPSGRPRKAWLQEIHIDQDPDVDGCDLIRKPVMIALRGDRYQGHT